MENNLNCAVVRDLLPSYVDGLTSDESNQAVEAHLEGCPDCTETLRRMREPEPSQAIITTEVDYLKKVRRRSTRKALILGIVLMVLSMTIFSYRFFYLGTAVDASDIAYKVAVAEDTVTIGGMLTSSGLGVSRVSVSASDGVVRVKVYTAPKTFFNNGAFSETYSTHGSMTQVWINDRIVWEDGTEIGRTASQLFAAKNPYIGNMSSNAQIASILGISKQFGAYTNELQTSQAPYGWLLRLEMPMEAERVRSEQKRMAAASYAMLTAVDNLGYVTWCYQTETGEQEYTVTAEDASAFAGRDIKRCSESAASLEALMQLLGSKQEGWGFN